MCPAITAPLVDQFLTQLGNHLACGFQLFLQFDFTRRGQPIVATRLPASREVDRIIPNRLLSGGRVGSPAPGPAGGGGGTVGFVGFGSSESLCVGSFIVGHLVG